MTASILLLGLLLLAAFAWVRSFDRSWRLRGAHVEPWWQRRHVGNEFTAKGPNRRRAS